MVDADLREINLRIDSFFGILILDLSLEIWMEKEKLDDWEKFYF